MSVIELAATHLIAQNTEATVTCAGCNDRGRHKLVARVTGQGVHLWCRGCHGEPLLSWAELDRLRGELLGPA